ncbi:MAG: hypothetical protein R3C18_08445 [Planctomycetaceae bacterium]
MTHVVKKFRVRNGKTGHRHLFSGDEEPKISSGRLPRITKMMALAIRFEQLIQDGIVKDQAEIARLGYVTRARVNRIMTLLHLAPDIQEAILNLQRVQEGKDPLHLKGVLLVAAELDWGRQREVWSVVKQSSERRCAGLQGEAET